MANYRLSHIDLSTRLVLAWRMLNPGRPWGEVTALARKYGVSRKFLYELRDRAMQALLEGLAPQPCGPKPQADVVVVDHEFLRRAIVILATAIPGTVRGIQLALELLFDKHRALGTISETLQAAGCAAQARNAELVVPLPILGEADEIFQGRRPCLTVVDGRSFLVVNLSPQEGRDATTRGITLLTLQEQGVQLQDLAADGARGIRAGLEEAQLSIPLRPDLFHLLQEGYRLSRRLEARAYRALETAERARRAEEEAQAPKRRRGRPLKVNISRSQAEEQARQAIEQFDAWQWLFQEVRQALEPFNAQGQLTSAQEARQTLETAAELMVSLNLPEVTAFAQKQLLGHLDELLAPLEWLEQTLAPWRENLNPQMEAVIIWAWNQGLPDKGIVDNGNTLHAALAAGLEGRVATLARFHLADALTRHADDEYSLALDLLLVE